MSSQRRSSSASWKHGIIALAVAVATAAGWGHIPNAPPPRSAPPTCVQIANPVA
jgi:hypothetical protein